MKKLLDFTEEEQKLVAKKCFPEGTSRDDIDFGIALAEQLGLNPLTREIMYVERRMKLNGKWIRKTEPLVGRDGFLSIAHRTGKFDGLETTVEIKKSAKLIDGEWQEINDLVAATKVWRKDMAHPIVVSVVFSEYAQYNSQGDLTPFWRTKPKTMLSKVAESQSLRRAFNISGVYTPEEIIEDMEVAETIRQAENPQPEPEPKTEPKAKLESEPKLEPETEDFSALKATGVEVKEENGFYVATGKTYQNKSLLRKYGFVWDGASKKWVKPVLKVA